MYALNLLCSFESTKTDCSLLNLVGRYDDDHYHSRPHLHHLHHLMNTKGINQRRSVYGKKDFAVCCRFNTDFYDRQHSVLVYFNVFFFSSIVRRVFVTFPEYVWT